MKSLLLILATAVFSNAYAEPSTETFSYEARVGAEVMLRQVLNKKALGPKAKNVYADIERALEGSGQSKTRNELTGMSCERGLGSDYCEILISGALQNGQGASYSYAVTARIYQGKFFSATLGADAKRSASVTWEVPSELKVGDSCPAQAIQNDEIAFQVGGHGGYVCYSCDFANQELVVKTQTRCNKTIQCESGVCY